jgi:hypothetical protein
VYHLESVRIDQNVNQVLLDRVTFLGGSDDNTARVFVTYPSGKSQPRNVTIRNSVFGKAHGSYNIDFGGGACQNFVFAYNTFTQERLSSCGAGSSITWVGNIGPKSANTAGCTPGTTWLRNVWQWDSDPRVCSGEAANNTWVSGARFEANALGLDANLRPLPGSPVLEKGEPPAGSYCTGALGSIDRNGDARPLGGFCDAGAFEGS